MVGSLVANAPTRGRAEIGSLENETHLELLIINSDAHGKGRHVDFVCLRRLQRARREGVEEGPGQTSRGAR